MKEDYLWDGTGEPDPEVQRLQNLLGTMQWKERPLSTAKRRPRWLVATWAFATAAAMVLGALGFMWVKSWQEVQVLATKGEVRTSRFWASLGGLRKGDWIRTRDGAEAELKVANIGRVTLSGDTELFVSESQNTRRRLELRYGTMHARIFAPPAVFVVDSPAARAIDLGCEYDLSVDREGNGMLRVSSGWVMLSYLYRQALVPEGAEAMIRKGGMLSPPYFEDASPEFKSALEQVALEENLSLADKENALRTLLQSSRKRDAYTLINLFRYATPDERGMIFDRLNELIPAPAGVTREGIVEAGMGYWDPWWRVVSNELGLTQIKKKGPIPLGIYGGFGDSK